MKASNRLKAAALRRGGYLLTARRCATDRTGAVRTGVPVKVEALAVDTAKAILQLEATLRWAIVPALLVLRWASR